MPHLLGAEALDIVVGSRPLFRGLTLGLDDGARVGVVGQNGAGKSTLLATLAGRRRPDGGRVTRTGGVRLEFVSQSDDLDPTATVRHAIHGDLADHEWASQAHIRDIHRGLLPDLDLEAPVGQLSGGQRRRVAGPAPERPVRGREGGARGRHPRPLVPRRRVHPHVGGGSRPP